MRWVHSICAAVLLAALSATAQQTTQQPERFMLFVRGVQVGTEEVLVARAGDGWTISSVGRAGAPLDLITKNLQIRYSADWKPLELTLDSTVRNQVLQLHVTVANTQATTHLNNAGQTSDRIDTIDASSVLIPNPFFASYEAVAVQLRQAAAGTTIPAYQGGQAPLSIRVGDSQDEQIQTVARRITARRTRLALTVQGTADVEGEIWADEEGRLLRFSVPSQTVEYVREDIASVSTRRVVISRPNDEPVRIPSNGFTLAGTISKPTAAAGRLPAVVLVAGSGPVDRDEIVSGIPIFGQLAGALADSGFLVLRYDKRGIGQSGGRAESAGLMEFADDLRSIVKFLDDRKDVDPKRIAVAGHSEGGSVALLAAAKDNKIAAVALLATNGVTGSEMVLAQQKHLLDRTSMSEADKQAKVDLQKKLHQAVITGKWEGVPVDLRRQIDNPEFQSVLVFDPAKVIPQVRQPMLIVQGSLDTQVDPSNADRLESLARARKRESATTEVVRIPSVNHLFVPATTGETEEYPDLKDRQIAPALPSALTTWLEKALPRPSNR
jgi:pimeloyl-ACP methyl ester carboxylesterase